MAKGINTGTMPNCNAKLWAISHGHTICHAHATSCAHAVSCAHTLSLVCALEGTEPNIR